MFVFDWGLVLWLGEKKKGLFVDKEVVREV